MKYIVAFIIAAAFAAIIYVKTGGDLGISLPSSSASSGSSSPAPVQPITPAQGAFKF